MKYSFRSEVVLPRYRMPSVAHSMSSTRMHSMLAGILVPSVDSIRRDLAASIVCCCNTACVFCHAVLCHAMLSFAVMLSQWERLSCSEGFQQLPEELRQEVDDYRRSQMHAFVLDQVRNNTRFTLCAYA